MNNMQLWNTRNSRRCLAVLWLFLFCGAARAGAVRLAWDPVPDGYVAGYKVYRSTSPGGPYEPLSEAPVPSAFYSDSNADAGKTYYYVVTAVDAVGHESAFSTELKVILGQYDPISPSGNAGARVQPDQVVQAGDMVILSAGVWNPDNKALTYAWSQTMGPAVFLSGQSSSQASFIAPNVTQDKWFAFTVTIADSEGGSTADLIQIKVLSK